MHGRSYKLCSEVIVLVKEEAEMNLSQIHYFIAIAETGYLSEASKQLKFSQPALSKYLIKLEQEVGLELFYREKKRLKPTRAGRLYLDAAYKIVGI